METAAIEQQITDILAKAGFTVDTMDIQEKEEGVFYCNIVPQEAPGRLIGRNGELLRSLQHVVKIVLKNQDLLDEGKVFKIDIDSYRVQQEDSVLQMADKKAQEALESQRKVTLPPMSSFFRRLVHLHVKKNYPQLTTFSKGMGFERMVCIAVDAESGQEVPAEVPQDLYAELEI